MNADLSALVRLSADFNKASREAEKFVSVVMREGAVAVRTDARANVKSSRIKSSISIKRVGVLEYEIGPTHWIGHFVEGGTSRQPPQPYMDPAADRQEPIIERRLGDIGVRLLLAA